MFAIFRYIWMPTQSDQTNRLTITAGVTTQTFLAAPWAVGTIILVITECIKWLLMRYKGSPPIQCSVLKQNDLIAAASYRSKFVQVHQHEPAVSRYVCFFPFVPPASLCQIWSPSCKTIVALKQYNRPLNMHPVINGSCWRLLSCVVLLHSNI